MTPDVAPEKSAALPLPLALKVSPPVDPGDECGVTPCEAVEDADAGERLESPSPRWAAPVAALICNDPPVANA